MFTRVAKGQERESKLDTAVHSSNSRFARLKWETGPFSEMTSKEEEEEKMESEV